jgi:Homeodomain-like domain
VTRDARNDLVHLLLQHCAMAGRKRISDDLRWAIVRMRRALPIQEIMRFTGIKRRTIERILSEHRRLGAFIRDQHFRAGRKRIINDADDAVSEIFSVYSIL